MDRPLRQALADPDRLGPRRGGFDAAPLSPQEKDELIAFIKQHFPEMHRRLQRFQQADPVRHGQALRRMAEPVLRMMRVSKTNPELAEIMMAEHRVEMELFELQNAWGRPRSEAERESRQERLRMLVGKRFDLRQKRLEMEIQEMRKRLDQAMARLYQQSADRAEIVEAETRRMTERLGSGPRGWGDREHEKDGTHAFPTAPSPGGGPP